MKKRLRRLLIMLVGFRMLAAGVDLFVWNNNSWELQAAWWNRRDGKYDFPH